MSSWLRLLRDFCGLVIFPTRDDPNIFLNQAESQSIISLYRSALFAGFFVALDDNKSSEPSGFFPESTEIGSGRQPVCERRPQNRVNRMDQTSQREQ